MPLRDACNTHLYLSSISSREISANYLRNHCRKKDLGGGGEHRKKERNMGIAIGGK